MSEVTHILNAIAAGDPRAAAQLLPLVYDELRRLAAARMAHEKPGQTLDATAPTCGSSATSNLTITVISSPPPPR